MTDSSDPQTATNTAWQAKRRAIINAAAEVFFERGFARGTTTEVAKRVGLTQPAIYHYVGSKDDLLSEIALQVDHDFSDALEAAMASVSDPVDQLRAIITSFVETMALNQHTYGVYWTEQVSISATTKAETDADQRLYVRRIAEVIAGVQQVGALPAERPTRIFTQALIGMLSWLHWWYDPARHTNAEIADTFCELIGIGSGPRVAAATSG